MASATSTPTASLASDGSGDGGGDGDANDAALAAQWAALKARRWREGRALTAHVQDLALAAGKRAVVATSGGSYKKFVCASARPCGWLLHAVCSRPAGPGAGSGDDTREWRVTSGSLAHAADCSSAARPTARQLRRSALLRAAVLDDARVSAATLAARLEAQGNLQCSRSMAYKAKTELLDALEARRRRERPSKGDGASGAEPSVDHGGENEDEDASASATVTASVQKLPSFLAQMAALNAHVSSAVERDERGRLTRAVLAMDPSGAWQAQGVLGLDTLEMQHPLCRGARLLLLLARDGNLEPLVLAAALAPSAAAAHGLWFVDKLLAHGLPLRRFPVFVSGAWLSDDAAAGALLAQLPHVLLSTRGVLDDVLRARHGVAVAPEDEALVWQAQRAESEREFLEVLAQLGRRNLPAAHCLKTALDARSWALYPHAAQRPLFGWQTTQLEAVDFGAGAGPQPTDQLPYECFQALALHLMTRSFARHERAVQWTREQRVVTPAAERLMQEQLARAGEYSVALSSPQLAFVWNAAAPQVRQRRVDLLQRTCSCAYRLQLGVPCRHTLAALHKLEQHALLAPSALDFFDECYLVRNYAAAFQGRYLELPLDERVVRDETLRAPPLPALEADAGPSSARPAAKEQGSGDVGREANPPGKTRKRRPRHKPLHERKRAMYKCRRCHRAEGHNRGTCPYDAPVPAPAPAPALDE